MYCIYVFVSVETNEKASLQWRALLGKLYFRELLGGGAMSILVEKTEHLGETIA